ncbi:MAG: DUF6036 family nucleotidyltransferase [Oscillospiraceae bacterium]|nr:DUF6036 family nucleotidyltransferase [Oscillospiraceae bacterium]
MLRKKEIISMDNDFLRKLLIELADELNKESKKNYAKHDLYVVGGAALILGYNLRLATSDMDAIWSNQEYFRKCINKVAKRNKLKNGWCNMDVALSKSYTPAVVDSANCQLIIKHGSLNVWAINLWLALCMKLIAFRERDRSDIILIVDELKKNNIISKSAIMDAFDNFYTKHGKSISLSEAAMTYIDSFE